MFVSPEVSRRARHGKYGYKLGRRKKLYLDKHILKPFVPVAKNIFFLKQKKKNEYPLLTTKDDKTLKYVGSLSNSNVLHYDPFLKIPTKKLASHFLSKVEPPKLPSDSYSTRQTRNSRSNEKRVSQKQSKKREFQAHPSPDHRNPFCRHSISHESRWLLSRSLPVNA